NLFQALDVADHHGCFRVTQHQHPLLAGSRYAEMGIRIHHEVAAMAALERGLHLDLGVVQPRTWGLKWPQRFPRTNPFHRAGGDGEARIGDGEKDHRFAERPLTLGCCSHCPPARAPNVVIARFSIPFTMSSTWRIWSTAPTLMASAFIPKITELASSWAITKPPA